MACQIEGFLSEEEGSELGKLVKESPEGAVIEIGSLYGRSAFFLSKAATAVNKDVYCVDIWGEADSYKKFWDNMQKYSLVNVVAYRTHSSELDLTKIPATKKGFSLLFIDGDHSFEAVSGDYEKYSKYVVPGGFIVFHDYGHPDYPGVKEACDKLLGAPPTRFELLAVYKKG